MIRDAAETPEPTDDRLEHDDHGGMARDLPRLLGRRRVLRLVGAMSVAGIVAACSSGADSSRSGATEPSRAAGPGPSDATSSTDGVSSAGGEVEAGAAIAEETAGPFPADGSNGPDVLGVDGVVRPDLRTSFGDASGTAVGIPMQLELVVVDAASAEPRAGAALYAWHCTADGRYSIYEVEDENYLRGVQVAGDDGVVTFATVFPGCYPGRWPHVHFEVYDSVAAATGGGAPLATSQLALPEDACRTAYGDERYDRSAPNLASLSLDTDMVFADGWSDQLAAVTDGPDDGYRASLTVRV
jgi:protocatechuate 3,4-dioxygenase beta subunit